MSMITATAWVPRGFPAPYPTKYDFDEAEFDRISRLAKLQLDDAKEDLEQAHTSLKDNDEDEGEDVAGTKRSVTPEPSKCVEVLYSTIDGAAAKSGRCLGRWMMSSRNTTWKTMMTSLMAVRKG